MTYSATSIISDKKSSNRVKRLYFLLAKIMTDMNNNENILDSLRSVRSHLAACAYNVENEGLASIRNITNKISHNIKSEISQCDSQISEKMFENESHKKRRSYILSQLSEYESPWNNRSFLIEVPVKNKNVNKDDEGNLFLDNEKLCRPIYKDIKNRISCSKFRFMLIEKKFYLKNNENMATSAIVTFSESDENMMKMAMIDIVKKYTESKRDVFSLRPENEAQSITECLPFHFKTQRTKLSTGDFSSEVLSSDSPFEALENISFQEQFVLMDIENYANKCPELRDFIQKKDGGSFGKSETGFRRAMYKCMELYYTCNKTKLNEDSFIKALDHEMKVAENFKNLSKN